MGLKLYRYVFVMGTVGNVHQPIMEFEQHYEALVILSCCQSDAVQTLNHDSYTIRGLICIGVADKYCTSKVNGPISKLLGWFRSVE